MAVTVKQMKHILKEIFEHTDYTAALWSDSGIGKDTAIRQLVEELSKETGEEWGYIDLRLSLMEPGDMLGLPYEKDGTTHYAVPWWFPTEERVQRKEFPRRGVIALQELNRAHKLVLQACFQFIERGHQLNEHKLARGWHVVTTLNPPTEDYTVNTFDHAFKGRMIHLIVKPDVNVWLEWAEQAGIDVTVRKFIETDPRMLIDITKSNFDYDDLGLRPNPRRYEMAAEVIAKCNLEESLLLEVLCGILGKEAAWNLIKFRREVFEKVPSGEELLKNYPQWRSIVKAYPLDRYNVACDNFVEAVKAICTDEEEYTKYADNIINFIKDIYYTDLRFATLRQILMGLADELHKKHGDNYELVRAPFLLDVILKDDEIRQWVLSYTEGTGIQAQTQEAVS